MSQITLLIASILGGLAVIFGAFGAHALKQLLSEEQLKSFDIGVKYQMFHAIVLLIGSGPRTAVSTYLPTPVLCFLSLFSSLSICLRFLWEFGIITFVQERDGKLSGDAPLTPPSSPLILP